MDDFNCVFRAGKRGRRTQQVGRVSDKPYLCLGSKLFGVQNVSALICSRSMLFRCGLAHDTSSFDIVHDSWAGQALLHQEMADLRQRRSDLKRQVRDAAKEERNLAKKRQRLMQVGEPGTTGTAGKQKWSLILPSSARVSKLTYVTIVGTRHPELDTFQNDIIQFGNYLQGEQCSVPTSKALMVDLCSDVLRIMDFEKIRLCMSLLTSGNLPSFK